MSGAGVLWRLGRVGGRAAEDGGPSSRIECDPTAEAAPPRCVSRALSQAGIAFVTTRVTTGKTVFMPFRDVGPLEFDIPARGCAGEDVLTISQARRRANRRRGAWVSRRHPH